MERVLIGAMGNSVFADTEYEFENGQKIISNFFIHAIAEHRNPDKVIVLLTKGSRASNWEGKDKLKYWFEEGLPAVKLVDIDIEDGKDETEAWKIFNEIAKAVPDNSEVIVDVTNGLRSIPILMLSALRYLQRVKKVTITEVYYCAADVVGRDISTKPVYSVGTFNILLDWANAVDVFARTGNSILLVEAIRLIGTEELGSQWNHIAKTLENLSEALDLLRVEQILKSSAILEKCIREINIAETPDRLRPFVMLVDSIRADFSRFAMEDTRNRPAVFLSKCLDLIEWYKSKKRYAEACLIAREWLISWYAVTKEQRNLFSYDARDAIAASWSDEIKELNRIHAKEEDRPVHLAIWKELRDARNNLGHPINESPKSASALVESINNVIGKLKRLNK